jgi:hypothetical protein
MQEFIQNLSGKMRYYQYISKSKKTFAGGRKENLTAFTESKHNGIHKLSTKNSVHFASILCFYY